MVDETWTDPLGAARTLWLKSYPLPGANKEHWHPRTNDVFWDSSDCRVLIDYARYDAFAGAQRNGILVKRSGSGL